MRTTTETIPDCPCCEHEGSVACETGCGECLDNYTMTPEGVCVIGNSGPELAPCINGQTFDMPSIGRPQCGWGSGLPYYVDCGDFGVLQVYAEIGCDDIPAFHLFAGFHVVLQEFPVPIVVHWQVVIPTDSNNCPVPGTYTAPQLIGDPITLPSITLEIES